MKYIIINEQNNTDCFVANKCLIVLNNYKPVHTTDYPNFELVFKLEDYIELCAIENMQFVWHVIFAHVDRIYSATFPTLIQAKEYKKQKQEEGFRCEILYAGNNMF